jgi:hypothetical protein
MNYIPKSSKDEEAGNLLAKEHTGRVAWRASFSIQVVKQFPIKRHTLASIGKGERLEYFCPLARGRACREEWLDFPTLEHYCRTHLFHFKKSIEQLTDKLINRRESISGFRRNLFSPIRDPFAKFPTQTAAAVGFVR